MSQHTAVQDRPFYTYLYLRQADGTPYYVGKGCGPRAFAKHRHIAVPEPARILIQYWADETEAFAMERYYIALFGRKDNGTGILLNFTDGGEGPVGLKHSDETLRKIADAARRDNLSAETLRKKSEAKRGNQINLGRVFSDEARRNMTAATLASGSYRAANHTRWHVQRNVVKEGCALCL